VTSGRTAIEADLSQVAPAGADLDAAIARALAFLRSRQKPSGEFPNDTWTLSEPEPRQDTSVFPAALIAHCLSAAPEADAMRLRSLDFLQSEMEPTGVWRHWTRENERHVIPCPDLDDTACASAALRAAGRGPDNIRRILLNRWFGGRFRSWVITKEKIFGPKWTWWFFTVTPSRPFDVDAVVNANVLFYLGRRKQTEPVVAWLLDILERGAEDGCDKWYTRHFVIWYFFSRALRSCEPRAKPLILRRLAAAEAATPLERALAISIRLDWGVAPEEGEVRALLTAQGSDGKWPREDVYRGADQRWGSAELVTAYAVEALARLRLFSAHH
jgi:hypothetical protein